MKKLSQILILVTTLATASIPQESRAGLLVGALGGNAVEGLKTGAGYGALVIGFSGAAIGMWGDVEGMAMGLGLGLGAGAIVGGLLEVDASLPTDQLYQVLRTLFPYIDNSEAVQSLALLTKKKYQAATLRDPNQSVHTLNYSEAELTQVFTSTDLTSEEFQDIVGALK
jgi:hypothetical protein